MNVMKANERRMKRRFELARELRYKMTGDGIPAAAGNGQTVNLSSNGVAFTAEHRIYAGSFVELSINWPVLLDDSCAMRLIVFGRVLRTNGQKAVCSIDKYEFRVAPRGLHAVASRSDGILRVRQRAMCSR